MVVQAAQEGPSSEAREKLSHDRNGSARTAEAEKVVIGDLDNDISLRQSLIFSLERLSTFDTGQMCLLHRRRLYRGEQHMRSHMTTDAVV